MKSEDHQDRLVDLLLWELVGEEAPPDMRDRVLAAADDLPRPAAVPRKRVAQLFPLKSARRSKAPAFAIAALLTLLAVAGSLLHFQQVAEARTPTLSSITGTVDRSLGRIPPGKRVSTGPHSSAVLTYPDGTQIELAADTTVVMSERMPWDWSKGFDVLTGEVKAEVAPQRPGRPMVLTSRHAHAEVVGTKLSFHLNEDRAHLRVSEGSVRFVPRKVGRVVMVDSGYLAESGNTGFKHERIPVRGITRLTLMNAETDRPIRESELVHGETISLATLPTRKLNIRADFEGTPPDRVRFKVTRTYGHSTGLPAHTSDDQEYPPFFAAGDHWGNGRPSDCKAWTPPAGHYRLHAEAFYDDQSEEERITPLEINVHFTE